MLSRVRVTHRNSAVILLYPKMTSVSAFSMVDGLKDLDSKKWIEVSSGSKLYGLLIQHIASHSKNAQSFSADVVSGSSKKDESSSCDCSAEPQSRIGPRRVGRICLNIGLGTFSFLDFNGNRLYAIHQTKGNPVGTQCGVEQFKNLVIFTEGSELSLAAFFSQLVEASEVTEKGIITIFNFHSRYRYWKQSSKTKARPLASVILPQETKTQVIADLENFMSEDMRSFYETHGIPYRRSYLFYGVPGAGKTSFIQAIAGHCNRSISFLQIDPEMTDVILRSAMEVTSQR